MSRGRTSQRWRLKGPDEVRRRFTATRLVLLGPLGLAFKKEAKSSCFIVVGGTFGEFIFQVKKKSVQQLRAQLAPWVGRVTPGESGPTDTETGRDRAEQLKDLADLRNQGLLTDAEFAAEKARILAE